MCGPCAEPPPLISFQHASLFHRINSPRIKTNDTPLICKETEEEEPIRNDRRRCFAAFIPRENRRTGFPSLSGSARRPGQRRLPTEYQGLGRRAERVPGRSRVVRIPGNKELRRPPHTERTLTRYVQLSQPAHEKERCLILTARDRVHLLLDPDTPFLELGSFAGFKLDSSSPSASLITGIGVIW